MNEARKLVADALRSGEYQQGHGCLAKQYEGDDWQYCCLGVACEVFLKNGGELEVESNTYTSFINERAYQKKQYNGTRISLPSPVQEWLQIDCAGLFERDSERGTLVKLNDLEGKSFAEIADCIETADFIYKEKHAA